MSTVASDPSYLLQVYRAVSKGEMIDECDVWVAELKLANPRQFSLDLAKMEKEWREAESRKEPDVALKLQADLGTERCLEMVERLLRGGRDG